jgi:hypothetical protein
MTMLKLSQGMGNHSFCILHTIFGANMHIMVEKSKRAPLIIAHHIKNLVSD